VENIYSIWRLNAFPALERMTREQKIVYTLRIACAMCFIGHGTFGIITKPIWCNYFAVFGIDKGAAYQLMPIVGGIDIALGIVMLIYPVRSIAAWLIIWGLVTACLRPLSGEPFAELIERAGNFGAPLAFLVLYDRENNIKNWFTKISPGECFSEINYHKVAILLKWIVFLLLLGHGWLNVIEKKGLLDQYASLGFTNTNMVAQSIGIFEISAAFILLIRPNPQLLLFLLFWKMASELFYPHYELFEFIERGGSYGSLMALYIIQKSTQSNKVLLVNETCSNL
jgi:hypothetical protein